MSILGHAPVVLNSSISSISIVSIVIINYSLPVFYFNTRDKTWHFCCSCHLGLPKLTMLVAEELTLHSK